MSYSHLGFVRAIIDHLPPFVVPCEEIDARGNFRRSTMPATYMDKRAVAERLANLAEDIAKKQGLPP